LSRDKVFQAVAVDVHAMQGVRFGDELVKKGLLEKGGIAAAALLVAPDAEPVGRTGKNVHLAVTVYVVSVHVRAGFAEVSAVERPGTARVNGGLFPPAARTDHVEAAVAVHVAHTQAVRKALRAGDL